MEIIIVVIIFLMFMKSSEPTIEQLFSKWNALTGVDKNVLKAVAIVESNLNPNALGDNGASAGLMQVQLLVGREYGGAKTLNDLFDPDINIRAGSNFLKHLISKYGFPNALQAYNLGETRYNRGFRSVEYMNKVLTQIKILERSA